uniref:Glycosyl transferase family 25 domain-containing protein n=1 Tax=viral metagenome TaxID=1070528 RepID=A0A6C0DLR5_9ZZZZ
MPKFEFNKNNTFCISLYSKPDRWEKMERRLKQTQLETTRWPAAVGGTADIKDVFQPYLNDGQRGCAQSHVNIWRHIQANPEIEYALVLEDDACFDKEWKKKLEQFHEDIENPEKRATWEIILLNASEQIHIKDHWVQVAEQFLTGGYIISQRGVKHILEMFHNNYASSDWMTSRLQMRWNSYSYFPWLIIQEGLESTIGSGVKSDHAKVIRCLNEINYSLENYDI